MFTAYENTHRFDFSCQLAGPDACQFDAQGMCFWKDMSAREYRWRRIKGNTPSKNTGPDGDHSTGEGINKMGVLELPDRFFFIFS